MSVPLEKIPPQNIDAEQSVLGSILIDKEALFKVVQIIRPEDFYLDAHQHVYRTVITLADRGEAIDLITVTEALKQDGLLEKIGGTAYVASLANMVPTSANVEYYAEIVEEKAALRNLISATSNIARLGYEGSMEIKELIDRAEQMIFQLANRQVTRSVAGLNEVLNDVFDRIGFLFQNKGQLTGVPTGFVDLDRMTSGFQPSDLIIVAARPSMGKTAFCLNIAQNAAIRFNSPVAIFSLEMSKEQLAQRILCAEAQIDQHKVRTGYVSEEELRKLARYSAKLSEAPIYIDDSVGITVTEMRAKARRLKAEKGIKMIIIDYLQLMQGSSRRSENRQQEISEISRSLKALARELNVPVVALSQLSRAAEKEKKPNLSHLRESGALEQDADVVMFIYRDEYYNKDSEEKGKAEIIVAKQRNGPVDSIELGFWKEYTKFYNIDKKHAE